jgi:hypothetical protein
MTTEYEARLSEWADAYGDLESVSVCNKIVNTGERLRALCLNDNAVDVAMKTLHSEMGLPGFSSDYAGERTWRQLWSETDINSLSELPLSQRLTSLNAYAFYGLSPRADGEPASLDDIWKIIDEVSIAIRDSAQALSPSGDFAQTLLAATGRFALDEGRDIAPEELAALARIGVKSMRNAMTPSSGSGLVSKNGLISASSALTWLTARGDFKTSIWGRDVPRSENYEPVRPVEGEILWVPFASDGSDFHPDLCRRDDLYVVGPKGAEESIRDYKKALERLARMRPAAYWRRPNAAGNWVIVTAAGFNPRTPKELGLASDKGARQ